MFSLLIVSFIAGVLTAFAPCIFPLLPVIVGGSIAGKKRNPYVIIGSLVIAIALFTVLVKVSSDFFNVPKDFWVSFSGVLVALVGLTFIFPTIWSKVPLVRKVFKKSNTLLATGHNKSGIMGDIIIGSSLAPAFTSCSPTYFLILAAVLPNSLLEGSAYLLTYAAGVGTILLFIALIGQGIVEKLGGLSDGKNWIRRTIGVIVLAIGIMILTGYDKVIETGLLDMGFIDLEGIERNLLESVSQ